MTAAQDLAEEIKRLADELRNTAIGRDVGAPRTALHAAIERLASLAESQPAERKPLTEKRIRHLHAFDSCLPDLVGVKDQWPEILRFARAIEKAHCITPADAKEGSDGL